MCSETGYTLPNNKFAKIRYGDILRGKFTKDVIVMRWRDLNRVIVKVVDGDDYLDLKVYLEKYGDDDLVWVKNITHYDT